jgi:hypothetical protein
MIRGTRGRGRLRKTPLKVIKRRRRWVKRIRSTYIRSPRQYELLPSLGMVGSDHDGEALNAARAADKLIKEHNLTWAEALSSNGSDNPLMTIRSASWRPSGVRTNSFAPSWRPGPLPLACNPAKTMPYRRSGPSICITSGRSPWTRTNSNSSRISRGGHGRSQSGSGRFSRASC